MAQPSLDSFLGTKPDSASPGLDSFAREPASQSPQTQTPTEPPFMQALRGVAGYFGNSIGKAAQSGITQIKQGAADIGSGKETPLQGAESGLSVESGIASLLSSPLAPLLKPLGAAVNSAGKVGDALAYLSTKVGLMTPSQKAAYNDANAKFANSKVGQGVTHVATDLSNAGNVAGTIAGTKGAVDTASSVLEAAKKPPTLSTPIAPDDTHIPAVAKDWQAPAEINKAAYNKARTVLTKDPTIPTTLAKAGINPFGHIEDGVYDTADTAESLSNTADKISTDVVRPALQRIDLANEEKGVPLTKATDLADAASLQVDSLPGITVGDRAAIKSKIASEITALDDKYPDGLNLENMHDEKINYSQNSGYNQFKSNADTNAALANKAISLTLKDAVEYGVPKDAPIQQTNGYLAKLYRAADYLQALNGKKAPVSTAQNIARFATRFGGAAIARHLAPGFGDLISTFAGYQIGKAVENALENMTNTGRAEFLANMQHTNPEVVARLQQYLQTPK